MSCLLLNTAGDVDVTLGKVTLVLDPVQAGAIKLRNRLNMFLGEWYADTRLGVPWFQRILVKNADVRLVQTIIRSIIVATPPFVDATVTVTAPDATRKSTCTFKAIVDPLVSAGATVTATSLDVPFIVDIPANAGTPS